MYILYLRSWCITDPVSLPIFSFYHYNHNEFYRSWAAGFTTLPRPLKRVWLLSLPPLDAMQCILTLFAPWWLIEVVTRVQAELKLQELWTATPTARNQTFGALYHRDCSGVSDCNSIDKLGFCCFKCTQSNSRSFNIHSLMCTWTRACKGLCFHVSTYRHTRSCLYKPLT